MLGHRGALKIEVLSLTIQPIVGKIEVIRKILDGACAAFHSYAGPDLAESLKRLSVELKLQEGDLLHLAQALAGALPGPHRFLLLRGTGV